MAAKQPVSVERGDHVYVAHPKRGVIAGRVLAHGKDGMTLKCDQGQKHKVDYQHYLGHKARVSPAVDVIDQGVDGAIVRDAFGRRKFVAGLQSEPPAQPAPAPAKKDDPLLDAAPMEKAMSTQPVILFLKAGTVANRPGLQLKDVTDKAGHQTKRWTKTTKDQPKGDEPGAADKPTMHHGQTVAFRHGDVQGTGKVVASGADGVTVQDETGREHQVRHQHLIGPHDPAAPGGEGQPATPAAPDAAAKPQDAKPGQKGGGDGGGNDGSVPPDSFNAKAYSKDYIDLSVTPADILKAFPPDTATKMDAITKKLAATPQTIETYKKDGKYTPERLELHKKIVAHILSPDRRKAAKPPAGTDPTFTILGGRGGSGKSWFAGKVYDPTTAIVLDADEIKQMLPEYEGWNAATVHEESGDLFDQITAEAQGLGLNIVHDATMKAGHKAVKLVKGFKDAGYRTEAHYMFLPPAEAATRAVHRFLGPTQRFVPPGIVLSNTTNEPSFDDVKALVDNWSFRDNNVARGEQPKLISESQGNETDRGKSGLHGLPSAGSRDGDRSGSGDGSGIRRDEKSGGGSKGSTLGKSLADGGRVTLLLKAAAPTAKQIEAGNYPKAHRSFQGLPVTIENPAGSVRSGVSRGGHRWSTMMKHDYGYIKGTLGSDGDHYDCYVGPHEDATHAYIVDTMKPPHFAELDEQKAMLGFASEQHAKEGYLAHYDNPGFLGKITPMHMDEFKAKVRQTREPGHTGILKALGNKVAMFFKAIIPGGAQADLFAIPVPVKAHTTKDGTAVAAHTAIRHKKAPAPMSAEMIDSIAKAAEDHHAARRKSMRNPPFVSIAAALGGYAHSVGLKIHDDHELPIINRMMELRKMASATLAPHTPQPGGDPRNVYPADELVPAEHGLPEGSTFKEGRGQLGAGKWSVVFPGERFSTNYMPSKAKAERKADQDAKDRDLVVRLLNGGMADEQDVKRLGLRPGKAARFGEMTGIAERLFGISSRKAREAFGDAMSVGYSDGGTKIDYVSPRKGLANAARWAAKNATLPREVLDKVESAFGVKISDDGKTVKLSASEQLQALEKQMKDLEAEAPNGRDFVGDEPGFKAAFAGYRAKQNAIRCEMEKLTAAAVAERKAKRAGALTEADATKRAEDTPSPDMKHFYVSAIDGAKRHLVAGPYASQQEAADHVEHVRKHADKQDGRAHFMAWGTAGSTEPMKTPLGANWKPADWRDEDNWHARTQARMKTLPEESLRYIVKDASDASRALDSVSSAKAGQYADEASYAQMELNARAKAKVTAGDDEHSAAARKLYQDYAALDQGNTKERAKILQRVRTLAAKTPADHKAVMTLDVVATRAGTMKPLQFAPASDAPAKAEPRIMLPVAKPKLTEGFIAKVYHGDDVHTTEIHETREAAAAAALAAMPKAKTASTSVARNGRDTYGNLQSHKRPYNPADDEDDE
jgi:predicted kinase